MPRPSDVYATFGAPGVYQATPCTPPSLPNVYVFPPEEDNQDVYCLFHSGSASPTTFESFCSHSAYYTQREPNSPTFTDLRALDHALSYFQRQSATHNSTRCSPRRSWEHDEEIQPISCNCPPSTSSASSRRSMSEPLKGPSKIKSEASVCCNARHLEAEGQPEDQWQYQSKSPSRRSSVFADRPPGHEAFTSRVREDQQASRKSQTMSLRSRAAMALKGLGSAMTRRPEGQGRITPEHEDSDHGPAVPESQFEPTLLRRKPSRQNLTQVLNPHINTPPLKGNTDLEVASTSSLRHKLVKRKSMLFGVTRTSTEGGTEANSAYPRPNLNHPAARSSPSLASPVGETRLPKRKSMTQLWRLGRDVSPMGLNDHIVAVDGDDAWSDTSETPSISAPRSPEGPYSCSATAKVDTMGPDLKGSQFPVSPATLGPTAPPGSRRKSFLTRRAFSFLDLHRHFVTDHGSRPSPQAEHAPPAALAREPSASFSPDSLSEGTDSSSSVAASTECERTIEDDMQFPMPHISTISGQGRVALAREFEPNMLSRSQLDLSKDIDDVDFSPRFGLEAPDDDDDIESEMGEDPPPLELAVRLDSLTFDQLVFDPESFTGSVYD